MSNPTMIETVARAICSGTIDPDGTTQDGTPYWRLYEGEARAALIAMRKPNDAVVEAGGASLEKAVEANLGAEIEACMAFHAMIDAALAEEPR